MAYAAGVDDLAACYVDTTAAEPVVAHPVFPVCLEWPSVVALGRQAPALGLVPDEVARGVHADHDLVLHRLVRAGDVLSTTATVVRVERRSPGAYQVVRLDTVDEHGAPVCTTHMGTLFLGVDVEGADRADAAPAVAPVGVPAEPGEGTSILVRRHVPAGAAHVYTECSRIWNPIHTDAAVARAAGLPEPILHGTATLAMAVSAVVGRVLDGDPRRVRRIACRFAAMVAMPNDLDIAIRAPIVEDGGDVVGFTVEEREGHQAIRSGAVVVAP